MLRLQRPVQRDVYSTFAVVARKPLPSAPARSMAPVRFHQTADERRSLVSRDEAAALPWAEFREQELLKKERG